MVYLIALISALTGFLFGFDEGIMSGALDAIKQDFGLNAKETGFMMGLMPFGALISAAVIGRFSDYAGRLRVLFFVPILFALAIFILITTSSYELLCVSRLLLGVSIGMSVVISPLYIAETAPTDIRGKLVIYFQLAITLGIFFSYAVNLWTVENIPWRWPFLTGLIPCGILFIGAFFLPESPRWLLAKNKVDEAREVLEKLYPIESYGTERIDDELEQMEKAAEGKSQTAVWRDLLSKFVRPALSLGVLLFFFQQLSGINVVIYYAPIIFKQMEIGDRLSTLLATVGIGALNVVMTLVAMRWVEKAGRRPLLTIGFIGTALSLFTVSLVTYLDIPEIRWVAAAALFVFIAAFAMSLGPLPWVMMPSIFPLRVRGQGASISAASNWLFNTIVVSTFPFLLKQAGISLTFALYGFSCVVGLLYTLRYLPETKGRSLEEIEKHIRSGQPLRSLREKKD